MLSKLQVVEGCGLWLVQPGDERPFTLVWKMAGIRLLPVFPVAIRLNRRPFAYQRAIKMVLVFLRHTAGGDEVVDQHPESLVGDETRGQFGICQGRSFECAARMGRGG